MTTWSTVEELAAAKKVIAGSIEGWEDPEVFAVGMTSATSDADYEFPQINTGGAGLLPAAIMATTVGHSHGSETYPIGLAELEHAIAGLTPAEACTDVPHPNLTAWREMLAEIQSNPARELVVVFVGRLSDLVESEAEASLRTQLDD